MSKSRRQFLAHSSLGLLGVAVTSCNQEKKPAELPPGAPPAFATAPPVGPEVIPLTFAEAEKLVQVELSEAERKEAVVSWRSGMAPLYERRVGPRKVALEAPLAPWSHCEAALPGQAVGPERNLFVRSNTDPGPLPTSDEDIAYIKSLKVGDVITIKVFSVHGAPNVLRMQGPGAPADPT